ncbi:Hypp2212 [Branchiostoma lanceolatum]|uniref:Hypp2212 protein n=1 Tax=Branchiostoma lanceolatum TaxID=7740 RepID=A0A8J9ZRX6_BRALA|nr:Hypp2212 [Branchiostoma lanceolatum]
MKRLNDVKNLTLETWHHTANALKVVEAAVAPELRLEGYHRPGAPFPGIMTYAWIDSRWVEVGWVRKKDKETVDTMARGKPEELTVLLRDAYVKKGYSVVKISVSMQ